jgi:hypothetical protein
LKKRTTVVWPAATVTICEVTAPAAVVALPKLEFARSPSGPAALVEVGTRSSTR